MQVNVFCIILLRIFSPINFTTLILEKWRTNIFSLYKQEGNSSKCFIGKNTNLLGLLILDWRSSFLISKISIQLYFDYFVQINFQHLVLSILNHWYCKINIIITLIFYTWNSLTRNLHTCFFFCFMILLCNWCWENRSESTWEIKPSKITFNFKLYATME